MSDDVKLLTSAEDFMAIGFAILGVQFYRLDGAVNEALTPAEEEAARAEEGFDPEYALQVMHEGDRFGVRLALSLDTRLATFHVDGAINYQLAEPADSTPAARIDIANRIGIMALLPYLRQAMADLTLRILGQAIVMPVMAMGALTFELDEDD